MSRDVWRRAAPRGAGWGMGGIVGEGPARPRLVEHPLTTEQRAM